MDEIRAYLNSQRTGGFGLPQKIARQRTANKPIEQAPWTHQEWLKVLAWHEAHHQGQAHITLNLYQARTGKTDFRLVSFSVRARHANVKRVLPYILPLQG